MEVLELNPIENKKIFVFLIKKEDNNLTYDEAHVLNDILEKYEFKFASIAIESAKLNTFRNSDLALFLNELLVPCFQVDIPEFAKGYLLNEIIEEEKELNELEYEYNNLEDKDSFKAQNLKSWIKYLKDQIQEKHNSLNTKIKANWIVKNLLGFIRYYEDTLFYENILYVIHFTPEKLIMILKQILEELGIHVIIGEINEEILIPTQKIDCQGAN
ncbi:MAG: hypothetical protein ACFFD2_03560 [Promethearchaeota archaeon]